MKRSLDFGDRGSLGELLLRLPYDMEDEESLGGLPACLRSNCVFPCPCELPLAPSAFDIDRKNRVWVNDWAKGRVAVFHLDGRFLFDMRGPGNNYRNGDIQEFGDSMMVIRQSENSSATFFPVTGKRFGESMKVEVDGKVYSGDTSFSTVDDRIFIFIFEGVDATDCCLGWAELDLPSGDSTVTAREVPGIGFLDGWLVEGDPGGNGRRIIYDAISNTVDWSVEVRFRLVQERDGERRAVNGNVSWEAEVSSDGTAHLLLFVGTYGPRRYAQDGYWYLSILPDGTVGDPVPIRVPDPANQSRPEPNGQIHRLTLDASGNPLLMWAGPRAVSFRRVPG